MESDKSLSEDLQNIWRHLAQHACMESKESSDEGAEIGNEMAQFHLTTHHTRTNSEESNDRGVATGNEKAQFHPAHHARMESEESSDEGATIGNEEA